MRLRHIMNLTDEQIDQLFVDLFNHGMIGQTPTRTEGRCIARVILAAAAPPAPEAGEPIKPDAEVSWRGTGVNPCRKAPVARSEGSNPSCVTTPPVQRDAEPALPPNLAWRDHDAAIDAKALATATEISLMWGQDRSQFVSRIQVAVTEAMRWLKEALPVAPLAQREAERDAARYRWLRMLWVNADNLDADGDPGKPALVNMIGVDLDEAIDAALSAAKEGQGK